MKKYKFNHTREDIFPKKKIKEGFEDEQGLEEEHDPEDEGKSIDAIKALIDMPRLDTAEERGKFEALIRGLVYADNPVGDKFLNAINDFTSTLKIEDYK